MPDHPIAKWSAFIVGVIVPTAALAILFGNWIWLDGGGLVEDRLDLTIIGDSQDRPAAEMNSSVLDVPGSTVHVRIRYRAETVDFLNDPT